MNPIVYAAASAYLYARKQVTLLANMVRHPVSSGWDMFFPGTKINYAKEIGNGLDSNVFMAPILYIARNWMQSRLAIKTGSGDDIKIDDMHAMARLIRNPNKAYSGAALWLATLISYLLDGNSYWLKVNGLNGQPAELWYVPHWTMTPLYEDKRGADFISAYRYSPGGGMGFEDLAVESVVHLRFGIDPENVRLGMAQLRSVLREGYTDGEAQNLVASLLRNKGIPGIIISPDGDADFDPDDKETFKKAVKDKFTGDKRGEPIVLSAKTKLQQFGFNPQEMDLSSVFNKAEERVCAVLGLPAAIVGFGSGMEQTKVGATLKELKELAWTDCIIPLQDMIASDLQRALLPDMGNPDNEEVVYDRSGVGALQDNLKEKAGRLDIMVRGSWMRVDEARKEMGLEVNDTHKIFLRGLATIEVNDEGQEVFREPDEPENVPAPAVPPVAPASEQEEEQEGEQEDEDEKHLKARKPTRAQARIIRAMDKLKRKFMRLLEKRMEQFFNIFGVAVERAWLEMNKAAPEDQVTVHTLMSSLDLDRFETQLSGIFGKHYVAVFNETVGVLGGMGLAMDIPDKVQVQILEMGAARSRIVNLSKISTNQVFEILANGREAGLGPAEIGRQLRENIPAGRFHKVSTRAELIARTETAHAQNQSALESYRNMEGVEQVMMLDARAGETDADCEAMNGRRVSFDEAQVLIDDEHPNGTRGMVPVLED